MQGDLKFFSFVLDLQQDGLANLQAFLGSLVVEVKIGKILSS